MIRVTRFCCISSPFKFSGLFTPHKNPLHRLRGRVGVGAFARLGLLVFVFDLVVTQDGGNETLGPAIFPDLVFNDTKTIGEMDPKTIGEMTKAGLAGDAPNSGVGVL